jgi:NADH dehydrogenase FAD-containing subunit
MSQGKIAYPLRELLRKHDNVEFMIAEVTGIDAAGRRVFARRPLGEQVEFGCDYLILTAGAVPLELSRDTKVCRISRGTQSVLRGPSS